MSSSAVGTNMRVAALGAIDAGSIVLVVHDTVVRLWALSCR